MNTPTARSTNTPTARSTNRPTTKSMNTPTNGPTNGPINGPINIARRIARLYEGDADRPVRGYTVVLGTYAAVVFTLGLLGRRVGARLPRRVSLADTALLGVATHKASRLLTKDSVTAPLRAPFARFEEDTGMGEVNESARGHGAQHAIGELATCPFCLAVWVSTAMTAGLVFAPRLTRLVASMLAAVAVSDTLQLGYDTARQLTQRASS